MESQGWQSLQRKLLVASKREAERPAMDLIVRELPDFITLIAVPIRDNYHQ